MTRQTTASGARRRILAVIRWLIGRIVRLALVMALLVLGAFGVVQTGWAKTRLDGVLSHYLTRLPDRRITIDGLDGFLPFDVRMNRLALSDAHGVWLEANGLRVKWSPTALLEGRIHVDTAVADRLRIERAQEPRLGARGPKSDTKRPFSLGRILGVVRRLPAVTIERAAIARLEFGEAIQGGPASLTVSATAHEGPRVSVVVESLDPPMTSAHAVVILDEDLIEIDAAANEQEGGLLARLLRIDVPGELHISAAGAGPLGAWQGRVHGNAWDLGSVDVGVTIAERAGYVFTVQGALELAEALLPERVAPLLEGRTEIDAAGVYRIEKVLEVERADIRASFADASVEGTLDFASRQIDGAYTVYAPDLARLRDLAQIDLAGQASLEGAVGGSMDQPAISVGLDVHGLRAGSFAAEVFQGEIDVAFLKPLSDGFDGVDVRGKGVISGAALDSGPPLPETVADWRFHAVGPRDGVVDVQALDASAGTLHVEATATADVDAQTIAADVQARADDLRRFRDLARLADLEGAATLGGHVVVNLAERGATGRYTVQFDRLAGFPEIALAVAGTGVRVDGELTVDDWRGIGVPTLDIRGTTTAHAAARLDLETKRWTATWRAPDLDLGLFAAHAERPMRGRALVEGQASGALHDFSASARVEIAGLDVDATRFEAVTANADVQGLPNEPYGAIEAAVVYAGHRLTGRSDFRIEPERWGFDGIRVDGLGFHIAGGGAVAAGSRTATASMHGSTEDLAPLGDFLGKPVEGQAEFDLRLSEHAGAQDIEITATAHDLSTEFARATRLALDGVIRDVLGTPTAAVTVEATELVGASQALTTATVAARGTRDQLDIEAHIESVPYTPYHVDAAATAVLLGGIQSLELTKLEGAYRDVDFRLARTAMVERAGKSYRLEGLALAIAAGAIEADASVGPEAIEAVCRWKDLPLDLAHLAGIDDIHGTGHGEIRVNGTAAEPSIRVDIGAEQVQIRAASLEGVSPARVSGSAEWAAGTLHAEMAIADLVEEPILGNMAVPMALSLTPFNIEIPEGGALAGHVEARADLATVGRLLLLDRHRVSGQASATFDLAGTIAQPVAKGRAIIENGAYEYDVTGTVLRNIAAEVAADGARIDLVRLSMDDGVGGTLSASGSLALDTARHLPFEGKAVLQNMRIIQRDDATATTDGNLSLAGTLDGGEVAGALTVSEAEIRVPERPARLTPAIEVVEVREKDTVPEALVVPTAAATRDADGLASRIGMDVSVTVPGRAFVRAPNLSSEWKGDFRVRGQARAPRIEGSLSAVRGHLMFLNQRFVLAASTVDLDGSYPPAPALNVTLETHAQDLTAQLEILGNPRHPEIHLASDPSLPQDEILARLLFGRELTEISPMRAIQLAQAAHALHGEGGTLDFLSRTRQTLGVDELELTRDGAAGEMPTINVGKHLGDRFYVEMEKDLEQPGGRVSVEAEVTRNITLKSDVGSDSKGGVWLEWEHDY
ncbi:MAG TPA: translocation/assembly module TamB domain-containing protein [Candidatus Hydrogenedentes bacterium]|nr:translocation/assembly module TamB domain-containing protein [Candidatus Hydrogenedentota bacterium]HPG67082.1 translocation/assembly module TamB domain-containing protein [Candidatus Hydrogenedentota bacterium]